MIHAVPEASTNLSSRVMMTTFSELKGQIVTQIVFQGKA
jgi:hypothetical protein